MTPEDLRDRLPREIRDREITEEKTVVSVVTERVVTVHIKCAHCDGRMVRAGDTHYCNNCMAAEDLTFNYPGKRYGETVRVLTDEEAGSVQQLLG